jgi:CubicO group peptidase (beta-lactamase class C family)
MSDYNNVTLYSGGGGLVSTAMDYMIFAESLRNGGAFNGNRILSPKTINFMTKNHLSASLSNEGGSGENPSWDTTSSEEANNSGFGFGLGFGLVTNTVARKIIGSDGEYSWGGAAGTIFWIDPVEELVVVTMIQLMSSPWKLREDMKIATYQSLIESYE